MNDRLATLASLALALAGPARATSPWEGPPFSGEPRAIAAEAEVLGPPRGAAVDVLLEEGVFRFDERGAVTFSYRLVYRPVTPEAARQWGGVERTWAPWHQDRPEIRARVVSPRGEVVELDPRSLVERGAPGEEEGIWTDRRVLTGPVPGVRPGAVVEELTVVRDRAPLFDGGVVHRFHLAGPHPVRLVRLRVEAPESLPLRFVANGVDASPREKVEGGVRTAVWEARGVPALQPVDPLAPRDVWPGPVVHFGWGKSWSDVAERYGAVARSRLAEGDVGAAAREALGGKPTREEAIRRVAAFVHRKVRYTGLELGDASIVPAPPAETLRRGHGDCKDLSLLVVALLAEAGIEARVALLRTGWQELPQELPGLGQVDHAIVRVEGPEPVWIDPTDPFSPPGVLPPEAQGRLALVTGPGTGGLVRTPEAGSAGNAATTVREIRLAELGPGRIAETRTLSGALAAAERSFRARVPARDRDAIEERHARQTFRAETFLGAKVEDEDDPSRPIRIRVEADRSAVVVTGDDEAVVPVTPDPIFEPLPRFLVGRGEDGRLEEGEPPARGRDLFLPLVYRWEIVYRVFPPDGFRARPLPAGGTERFGPATYAQVYALEADGSITATFRFDLGARRLAAKDADELGRRVRALLRGQGPRVAFERTAAALLASGRVTEGLAEIRRLVAAHPRESMHRLHLAIALLQLGFAEEAAAEARRAIQLEPDRAWAHRVLGYVLEHDGVGRYHGPGFDRASALLAYEAARARDSRHAGGRAALAELLAHAPSGERHGRGADLERAVREYESIRTELESRDYDGAHLAALLAAGRFEEAVKLAGEMDPAEERNALWLAALAAARSPEAALAASAGLGEARRAALRGAAGLLLRQRRYPPASALAAEAARGALEAAALLAQAETFGALRKWEDLRAEGDEPTRLVKRLLVAAVSSADPGKELAPLVPARLREGKAREWLEAGLPLPVSGAQRALREAGVPPDVLLDLILTKLETVRDGSPAQGLRIRVRFPFAPAERGATVYLREEGGALRLLASDHAWPLLGIEAERLAAAGDLAGARRWLDWAVEAVPGTPEDPSGPKGMLTALWSVGGDLGAARRAGAALAAFVDSEGRTLTVLTTARLAARGKPAEERALLFALGRAHFSRGDAGPLLAVADELLASDPGSRPAFQLKVEALRRLRRLAALWPAADAILARHPDDPDVLSLLGSTAIHLGDLEGGGKAWRRLVEAGKATPLVYNDAAWLELFQAAPGERALDWARRAVDQGRGRERAHLNTLAAVYAAQGKPAEAREIFLRSLEGGRALSASDWLVYGWIAEGWGLVDAARAAYGRVTPEKGEVDDPLGAHVLARRRLEALDGGGKKPASGKKGR